MNNEEIIDEENILINSQSAISDNRNLIYLILLIIILSFLLQIIVFFYLIPKEISIFKKQLNDINKFEKKVNLMEIKFNEIYSIISNFCELHILNKICYKNSDYKLL